MNPLRLLLPRLIVGLLASFAAIGIQAAQLQIQFAEVNLEYSVFYDAGPVSGDIFDGGGVAGGAGDPASADPLSFMDFQVDGVSSGARFSDIYLDTFIQDVWNIPVNGARRKVRVTLFPDLVSTC